MAERYPATRTVDAVVQVGDVIVDDPYRWLEDDTAEVLAWQAEQDRFAHDHIHAWPHFDAVRAAVSRYPVSGSVESSMYRPPVRVGTLWFERVTGSGPGHQVLRVSDEPGGQGRVVVDPRTLSDDPLVSFDRFVPSPDGRLVACFLSEHGQEDRARLHLIDVATGELVTTLPFQFDTVVASVAWLPDGSSFFCNPLDPASDRYLQQIVHYSVGSGWTVDLSGLQRQMVTVAVSPDGAFVTVYSPVHRRPTHIRALPGGSWQTFLDDVPGTFNGTVVYGAFYAVTSHDAPRGRLVRIPVATASDPDTWTELVAESSAVLTSLAYRAGRLVLGELVDTYSRLRVVGLDGADLSEIPLPEPGCAESTTSTMLANTPHGGASFVFPFATFSAAMSAYEYDVETRRLRRLTAPSATLTGLATSIERCAAGDGYPVTYHLVHRAGLDLSEPRPVFIHAYGDGGAPWLPSFLGPFSAFTDAGGIYVHANLRGGGEHGEEFHQRGRLAHKQGTFDDLHTIAEDLIARGLTKARRIAVLGASSGGLMAGVAATQRPDLFGVCILRVPPLDLLRVVRDPYTLAAVQSLFGDPTVPDGARHLLGFSPYHLVRDGVEYPAVLIECGDADHRCPPWHGRKTVARLQGATGAGAPALLRVWPDAGHVAGIDPETRIEQNTEWLAFTMRQLGMAPL